jgi:hypothetical protein
MNTHFLRGALLLLTLGMVGCATKADSAAIDRKPPQQAEAEAPLGSRIRKRNAAAPVSGALRETIEQGRVQQNAIDTGAANRGR